MNSPINKIDIEKMENNFEFIGDDSVVENVFAYMDLIETINSNPKSPNLITGQQTFEEYVNEIRNPNLIVSKPDS